VAWAVRLRSWCRHDGTQALSSMGARLAGIHAPIVAGIFCGPQGAYSIALSVSDVVGSVTALLNASSRVATKTTLISVMLSPTQALVSCDCSSELIFSVTERTQAAVT
jgi:hypothetical protein